MPLQNRVTPLGELIAVPDRGLVYGNRGCMHDADGRIRRPYGVLRWIACRLEFRGWKRGPLLQPGKFTELFFLDEATALAAGHRPCALCSRADYDRFLEVWSGLHPGIRGADPIDVALQAERWDSGSRRRRLHATGSSGCPTARSCCATSAVGGRRRRPSALDPGRVHEPGVATDPRRRHRRHPAVAGRTAGCATAAAGSALAPVSRTGLSG